MHTLSSNDLSAFFITGTPVFINGPQRLPINPPDCIISDSWVFDRFILTDNLSTN